VQIALIFFEISIFGLSDIMACC